MKRTNSVDDILLYAIKSEKETADFYLRLSSKARNTKIKRVFEQYAREEFAHISKLTRVRDNGPIENMKKQVSDFKISDYSIDLTPASNLSYSDELVLGMRKVRATLKLYFQLASNSNDNETRETLKSLTCQEEEHKRGFEIEYNESLLLNC